MAAAPDSPARTRRTTRAVVWGDRVARVAITFGGIGTIGAVALVMVYLVAVVLPLFGGAELRPGPPNDAAGPPPVHAAVDPDGRMTWRLLADGSSRVTRIADGSALTAPAALPAGTIATRPGLILVGTAAGEVHEYRLHWHEDGARLEAGGTVALASAPIVRLDRAEAGQGEVLAAITADHVLRVAQVTRRTNLLTGEERLTQTGGDLPLGPLGVSTDPDHLLLLGAGDNVCLLWQDGRLLRIDCRDPTAPQLAEKVQLLAGGGRVTAVTTLIGGNSLLVGTDTGAVSLWFRIRPDAATTSDGVRLERARDFPATGSPVTTLAPSQRSRLFACGHQDGSVRLLHGTSGREMAAAPAAGPLQAIAMAPKEDGLLAITGAGGQWCKMATGHPEVTLAGVFRPVWYEGYPEPDHTWQSTGGTDDFEPKFGLWPLLFGTIKATLYCLLLAVPLALLAALYTSEFLHPRTRARIKPTIELMASLPSVVLGFLAALVIAPFLAPHVPGLLAAAFTLPLCWLLAAELTQGAQQGRRLALERRRLLLTTLTVLPGLLAAWALGAAGEALLFGGDFLAWLADPAPAPDTALGGILLLTLPAVALLVSLVVTRLPLAAGRRWGGLIRLGGGLAATVALSLLTAALLAGLGWDARSGLFGTYVQRNAVIVGIAMGFAVIPIIYTIAEDALQAVPEHLRAASLGAGATPWQTAARIVLPTALSGVFSAVMVGMGRAVGETMIVLMAAGNTPVLDLNPFNGFRTLSANIAVELPEAVPGSTHYRMLYLAALVLFALTFAVNSIAELVRLRFRRRAMQL